MTRSTGQRGPALHERLLRTAAERFAEQGIRATSMEDIAQNAGVTVRTLYAHFASKDALTAEYLMATPVTSTADEDSPVARMLAVFDSTSTGELYPGCPFLRAAAEFPERDSPVHLVVRRRKLEFADRLRDLAEQAGCADPEAVGATLALLYDGAAARSAAISSREPFRQARTLAEGVVDAALVRRG